ncbi:MAG: hypothetical protein ACI8V2_000220 [Candidatus Latescibacterota bacterium]|jgi:hypothetical protein
MTVFQKDMGNVNVQNAKCVLSANTSAHTAHHMHHHMMFFLMRSAVKI